MAFRASVRDFQLANPLYVGAEVRFFTVDINGAKTTTLATLYANPTGSTQLVNPQTLDGDGKFVAPVYFEQAMVAEIIGATVGSGETGIIQPVGRWRGLWTTATMYLTNDFIQAGPADPLTEDNIYVARLNFMSLGTLALDIAAGNVELVFDAQDFQVEVDAAIAAAAAAEAAAATLNGAQRTVQAYQSAPPGSPTTGHQYLVLTAGSGAWAGQSEKVATWTGSAWTFLTPSTGWSAFNIATNRVLFFFGGVWRVSSLGLDDLTDVDLVTTPPTTGDGLVYNGTNFVPGAAGGGMFRGNNGTVGSRVGDIIRVNAQTLTADVTIAATENASATGPLAVNTGITLTVSSGATLVVI
jgi:hypothetical protein